MVQPLLFRVCPYYTEEKEKGASTMINEKVAVLLNQQINAEFYSAYLYLDFYNFYVANMFFYS